MELDQKEAEQLAQHIANLGISGDHWLLSENDCLLAALRGILPPERVRVGQPEAGSEVSVVVIDPDNGDYWQQLIGQLSVTELKPLLILTSRDPEPTASSRKSLHASGYRLPAIPIKGTTAGLIEPVEYDHKRHFDVAGYWEQRYASGRDSGAGSYGRLARFKAQFLNRFVAEHDIETVVELGCGDGAQLGLSRYPEYVGLDISRTAVEQCRRLFEGDDSKRFQHYDPEHFAPADFQCDLALSLDVVYHLANDRIYQLYLKHLFSIASRHVIIYSNSDRIAVEGIDESASYIRFRDFLVDIDHWYPDWSLVSATANRFPYSACNPGNTSISDFYVFERSDNKDSAGYDNRKVIDRMVQHKILNALTIADENTKTITSTVTDNGKLLQGLKQRVEKLSDGLNKTDVPADGSLKEFIEVFQSEGKQSLSMLEKLHGQISRIEASRVQEQKSTIEVITQCNQLLEEHVAQLQHALDRKQRELDHALIENTELKHQTVPEIRQQLEETRRSGQERIEDLTADLARTQDELTQTKRQEIPRLKRRIEIEQRAAERSISDLRASLTWQAGACFREAAGSLRGLIRLPISLLKVWRKARRSAQVLNRQPAGACRLQLKADPAEWIALPRTPIWLNIELQGEEELAVLGRIRVKSNNDEAARCGLVRIEYLDRAQRLITAQYAGANFSRKVGHYKYLHFRSEEEDELFRLRPPREAHLVRLGFQSWEVSEKVEVANGIRVVQAQRQKVTARRQFQPPSAAVQEISILGWPEPVDNGRPLVLSVMDEFTEGCFEHDLRLLQPRPDNWYALAQKYPPVMAFVESAWKGNGGSWQYRVGSYSIKPGRELEDMMIWAQESGVPSVFWNKEDPVHHEKFMEAASLADHVFTTDENMIESYKRRTGNSSVHALPFAAQPALHKPAALEGRIRRACFAGSWYGDRHVERGKAMKWLLQAALKHGLDIFDRNHGSGNFPFPEEYQEGIRGGLPYRELCREYPRYRLFLNVNSVTDSPTMFSRRVFELLACGTPVVSTYARGLEELFETDAVWLVRNQAEADEAIHTLLTDDEEWRRRSLAGIREVFSRHTYAHRINQIFETIGISDRIETEPRVLLVARVEKQSEIDRLVALAEQQTYRNFDLLVECSAALKPSTNLANVHLVRDGELQSRINVAVGSVAAVGWLAARHQYGPDYLRDLVNAMTYQPDALGWAKATGGDAFRFGTETHLMAAIWQPQEFLQRRLDAPEESISSEELYCADAEGFMGVDSARPARQAGHD